MHAKKNDTIRNKSTHIQLTNDLSLKAVWSAQSGIDNDGLTEYANASTETGKEAEQTSKQTAASGAVGYRSTLN